MRRNKRGGRPAPGPRDPANSGRFRSNPAGMGIAPLPDALTDPIPTAGDDSRVTRFSASEIKFILDPDRAGRIRTWARARLGPDPHGAGAAHDEYTIKSLYFDTEHLDVYNRRGSYARGKYRARRYGDDEGLYLERKLRTRSLLSKRRTRVTLDALRALDANPLVDGPGRWFHKRLIVRELRPSCQIAYRRMARQSPTPHGAMRLTIDQGLHARRMNELVLSDAMGIPVASGRLILEIKFRVELPVLFKQLIEEFALSPLPISKYRLAMDALRGVADATPHRGPGRRPGHGGRVSARGTSWGGVSSILEPCSLPPGASCGVSRR
jgi:hypothetical protein